jgi:osmotically-inducible protein OsmY
MDFRVNNALERNRLTKKEAINYIKKVDDKRVKWTKFLYNADLHDPSLYDIVINLDNISLNSACEIVCNTASLEEFARTPEWQKIMDDLALSTEVRAIIATSKGVADSGLEVEANGGLVTLGGTVGSVQDADRIREIAKGVAGVQSIVSKMQVKSTW